MYGRMMLERAVQYSLYENEEWKHIPGFPGYVISNYGQIYSWRSDRLMRPSYATGNYLMTALRFEGKTYSSSVHRLVAITFLGEPSEPLEVNHIDGDPTNNYVRNLEWNTPEENARHRREVLRRAERWREEQKLRKEAQKAVTNVTEETHLLKELTSEVKEPQSPTLGRRPDGSLGVIWS